jgi:non-canonical (house-cleaning) NTP pyrophosphatase
MTGTICVLTSHSLSRSYLNHLVVIKILCIFLTHATAVNLYLTVYVNTKVDDVI